MPGHIPPGGILGRLFYKYLQTLFLFRFIPLLFIVGIRYVEATFAALIRGGCKFAVFCRCFLIFASHVCYSVSCSGKSPLQVCNFTLRRFRVFLLHCCRLYWRRLVSCCFHCVYYYVLFLIAMQRYKLIWKPPNKKPKIFVYLTFYNK